jgi:hypothetical protein
MKRLTIALVAIAIIGSPSLFANGPMPADNSSSTSNSNTSPGRERWTKHRIEHLRQRRQAQKHERGGSAAIDILSGVQMMNDPFAQTAADRQREAIRRQREIDAIEFLALKKERGELSPAGQKKLNQLIRHVQNQ